MLRAVVMALFMAIAASLAAAQTSGGAVMGSNATAQDATTDQQPQVISILAIGDAVGGGLGAGLTRMGEADGRYDVTIRYNEESGLARPEVYDWATTLSKILSSSDYDVITVLLGTNDRQTIRDGTQRYAFDTPEWVKAYTAQIDNLVAVLKTSGARVYWISIPPMQDADYDSAMRRITELQKARVEANGMTFVDVRPSLVKPDGSFAVMGADNTGEYVRLRARDGVGFYKAGNNLMGQLVLQVIEKTPVPKPVAAEQQPQPEAVQAQDQEPGLPVFGQAMFGGEVALVPAEDLAIRAASVLTAGAKGDSISPSSTVARLKAMAMPGSEAEKFFSGAAAPAPAGRADDFSVPAAPAQ